MLENHEISMLISHTNFSIQYFNERNMSNKKGRSLRWAYIYIYFILFSLFNETYHSMTRYKCKNIKCYIQYVHWMYPILLIHLLDQGYLWFKINFESRKVVDHACTFQIFLLALGIAKRLPPRKSLLYTIILVIHHHFLAKVIKSG